MQSFKLNIFRAEYLSEAGVCRRKQSCKLNILRIPLIVGISSDAN